MNLFDRWTATRAKNHNSGLLDERRAAERLIAAWPTLDLIGTGVYDGDILFAADVQELAAGCAIGHLSKADVSYRGSFSLLMRSSAEYLSSLGYFELNVEQDLGIQGLRMSKLRWRPVRMVRKYRVRARTVLRNGDTSLASSVHAAGTPKVACTGTGHP